MGEKSVKGEELERVRTRVSEIAKSVVEKEGLEIYELLCYSNRKGFTIQLVLDREDGVVGVDDCVVVSRNMNILLEDEPIGDDYTLEVSSPGIERRLRSKDEYERFKGEVVLVRTTDGMKYEGRLMGIDGDTVVLEVVGEEVRIGYDEIKKGQIKMDMKKILKGREKEI